jgi:hypothetical protein
MPLPINLPANFKVVSGCAPTTTNAAVTGDYVSLKNCHKAWVVFHLKQAVAHATVCSIMKATAVAPTGGTAMTATVPNWLNDDVATDAFAKGTDAASVTVTADAVDKIVIIEVDPSALGATYDCIAGKTTASSQATDFVAMLYILAPRYEQALPPAAITD